MTGAAYVKDGAEYIEKKLDPIANPTTRTNDAIKKAGLEGSDLDEWLKEE